MHWPKKRKLKLAENSFAFATCFWVTQTASRIVGNAPDAARGYEWREREPVNKMDAQGVAWQAAGMLLCLLSPRIWGISRSPCLALSFSHCCTVVRWARVHWTFPHCAEVQFHSLSYVRRGQPSWQKERCDARELKENISETPTDRKMSFWQENMGFIQVYICLL